MKKKGKTVKRATEKKATAKAEAAQRPAKEPVKEELREIAIEKVIPTADNRAVDPKDPKIQELAASIAAAGQLVPVIVRPHPKKPGYYELRAGARRLAACQVAKRGTVLATVRAMTDQEAMTATVLENLQREDLTPAEEAQAVAKLLATGRSLRDVAADVGRSHQWVARRARLTKLIPEWQKRFEKCETPATGQEIIAQYEPDEQKALLSEVNSWCLEDPQRAPREIAHGVQRWGRELQGVPWKLDDKTLQGPHGACATCPKRTGARPAFEGRDRCLDAACYDGKRQGFLERREKELRAEHPKLVKVSRDYGSDEGGLNPGDWKPTQKTDKKAEPALIVAGAGAGTLTWIRRAEWARDRAAGAAEGPKSMKLKRQELEAKRWCETVKRFRDVLKKTPIEKLDRPEIAIFLAATFGTGQMDGEWEEFEALLKQPAARQIPAAASILWERVKGELCHALAYYGPVTNYDMERAEVADAAANTIHFDLHGLFKAVCQEKGFTEPACWADEAKGKNGKETKAAG